MTSYSKQLTVQLMQWFERNKRPLPFRYKRSAYKTLVSEIMAQQTTMPVVVDYYKRWMRRFPTLKSLAQADLNDVLKAWEGLGYYQRARHLHKAAKFIVEAKKGRWPRTYDQWRRLPGVGPYTAAALASLLNNEPVAAVDGNVRRIAARFLGWNKPVDRAFERDYLLPWIQDLFQYGHPGCINEALMELGSVICLSRQPQCVACPIKRFCCCAHRQDLIEKIPFKKTQIRQNLNVAVAIITKQGKIFFQQRKKGKLFEGLWELPGGKIEGNEKPHNAIIRELKEELGMIIQPQKAVFLFKLSHSYTRFRVKFYVYKITTTQYPKASKFHKYLNFNELKNYPMPSGTIKILKNIR